MYKRLLRLTCLTLMILSALEAFALSVQITHIDSTSFPEIEALFRVYDDTEFQLKGDSMLINENGRQIASYSIEPVSFKHFISMLVDRSSSMENSMHKVKMAASGFVRSLIDQASFAIISFGSDIDFNHDFSTNLDSLISAIKKIRPWGGTLLYDAIYDACEDLQARSGLNDLKTILCITDGKDSTPSGQTQLSTRNADEVIKYAVDKSIRVITIGLGQEIDPVFLKRIADETGGWYLHSASADELARLCRIMSNRIKRRCHYKIRFKTLDTELTSDARAVEIVLNLNDKTAKDSRSYHVPNSCEPGEQKPGFAENEKISLSQLFQRLSIPDEETRYYTENIRPPHPKPVYGLTSASFRQASRIECRQLINQAREEIAAKHRANLDRQNHFFNNYLKVIDNRLKHCYKEADRFGISLIERTMTDKLVSFLLLRRKLVEALMQQAYEIYMVSLKASLEELNYFDRIEVLGQKQDDQFLDKNASAKAEGLASIKNKFSKQISEINRQLKEMFLPETTNKPALKPVKATTESVIETLD